jgi:hypothetical protein
MWDNIGIMSIVDNIVLGTPIVPLEDLGVTPAEGTMFVDFDEVENDKGEVFLPILLKHCGLFDSTSQVKQAHTQRIKSTKIKDELSKNLWRNIEGLEFTHFKIGRKIFWLIVGER